MKAKQVRRVWNLRHREENIEVEENKVELRQIKQEVS